VSARGIAFRPMREDDLPLLHDWLQRGHVKRWWRDTESYEQTLEHYGPALRGEEPTHHYVVAVDDRDVGMVQTYLASAYPEWAAIVGAGPGVAGLDILIGEKELIGRGVGAQVLAAFACRVAFASRDVRACVATVEETNRRSWRAFEKAGFRHVGDVEEDGLPHRLMRLDRKRHAREKR
jgi:aminoglycoside 6'-N-acetyltransferase